MTKKQINLLIKHADIWPYESGFKAGMSDYFFQNPIKEEKYFISNKLLKLLNSILEFFLDGDIDDQKQLFLEEITEREKIFLPGTLNHVTMLNNFILEQSKLYESTFEHAGNSYRMNGVIGNNKIIIPLLIQYELLSLDNNAAALIAKLKFDLLEGKIIDTNSFEHLCSSFKVQYLERFFYNPIGKLADKIAAEENIKHIQNLIKNESTFEHAITSNKTKDVGNDIGLTHQAIALLCILNGTDLYTLEQCREALQTYNPSKSQNQAKALQKIFKQLIDEGITISCTKKITGNARIKALRSIFNYLNTDMQRAKLKAAIYQITSKMAGNSKR